MSVSIRKFEGRDFNHLVAQYMDDPDSWHGEDIAYDEQHENFYSLEDGQAIICEMSRREQEPA